MANLTSATEVTAAFRTTLERAFRSPMLCDVRRVHSGYLATPRVTGWSDDATWGRAGGTRVIHMARTSFFKGGEAALDKVLARVDNEYWKIGISEFRIPSMGFDRFEGEWSTSPLPDGRVRICYRYTMFSHSILAYPLHWLFTKTIWRMYMRHVLENIRQLTLEEAPYLND